MLKSLREKFIKLWHSGRTENRISEINSILEKFEGYITDGFDRNDLIYWILKEETDEPKKRICPVCGNKIVLKSVKAIRPLVVILVQRSSQNAKEMKLV